MGMFNRQKSQQPQTRQAQNAPAQGPHKIICPFCNSSFAPSDVKFRFELDGGQVEYFSIQPNMPSSIKLYEFCEKNGYDCKLRSKDGVPTEMVLEGNRYNIVSPLRVCANDACNQLLSGNAGFYEQGNGIFFLGLKGVGKTVMITTLIEVLKERAALFGAGLSAYNKSVQEEYENYYYRVMYRDKTLPNATIAHSQLTYEWVNKRLMRLADLTFSDIRGEDADNMVRIFSGEMGMNIQKSKSFVVDIDLNELAADRIKQGKTEAIFHEVLQKATLSQRDKKYLAIVITKSDALAGKFRHPIFQRQGSAISPIYRQMNYQKQPFAITDRETINQGIREVLRQVCPGVVAEAENVFLTENVGYFAVSALGCAPAGQKLGSERPMPIRVEEPVLWLLMRMGLL